MSIRFPSPLRYPGGKNKIANFIKLVLLKNGIKDAVYVEPYAGGAGVALSLLYEEYASEIYINDLNKPIYSFWYSVVNNNYEFCKKLESISITVNEWEKQKEIQSQNDSSLFELGFSTFYLNRCNRSGIIDGGIIGGKEQDGKWKIDARFNPDNLIARIKKIGRFRNRIYITNKDAGVLLDEAGMFPQEQTLFYLDPPYYVKGKGLYQDFYTDDDHTEIANKIDDLDYHWIISYDNHEFIKDLYAAYNHIEYDLSYSAQNHYKGSEVMFFSDNLNYDYDHQPIRVKHKDLASM